MLQPFYRRGDMAGLTEHKGFLGRELARFYCAQLVSKFITPLTNFLVVTTLQDPGHPESAQARDYSPRYQA